MMETRAAFTEIEALNDSTFMGRTIGLQDAESTRRAAAGLAATLSFIICMAVDHCDLFHFQARRDATIQADLAFSKGAMMSR